jgi:hypothetical protein
MRILFIAHHFPPYNTIGALRCGKTARWLLNLGQDIRVITAKNQPLPKTLPLEIPNDRVYYCATVNLSRPAEIIMGGRQRLSVAGFEPAGPWRSITKRLKPVYTNCCHVPDPQVGWVPFAIKTSIQVARNWKPDLILASATPFSGLLVAHIVSKVVKVPWVAEFRDLWCDNPYYPYSGLRKMIDRQIEKAVLRSVSGCITVSEPLAATLRHLSNVPVTVVPNAIDDDVWPNVVSHTGQSDVLRIVHTGTLIRGKRDPRILFEAVKRLDAEGTISRVEFYGRNLQSSEHLARELQVEHLVLFSTFVSYEESLRLQRGADVLLLLLWDDPREQGTTTGKLFEYLGARRPILMIGPRTSAAAAIIQSREVGVVCNSTEEVYDNVSKWASEKRCKGQIEDLDKSRTLGMSRRDSIAKLLNYIEHIGYATRSTLASQ